MRTAHALPAGLALALFTILADGNLALADPPSSQEFLGRYQGQHYLILSPAAVLEPPPSGWPILVFLHGYNERGQDVERLRYNNTPPGRYAKLDVLHRNFLLIAPQLASTERFWNPVRLRALLRQALDGWPVDWSRLTLTGLSIGATGVWDYVTHFPEEVSAAASFSGIARPTLVDPDLRPFAFDYEAPVLAPWQRENPALARVPFMAFHCEADLFIPFRAAARMVIELNKLGNENARIIPVPGCGHGSWPRYYKLEASLPGNGDRSIYDWLLNPLE